MSFQHNWKETNEIRAGSADCHIIFTNPGIKNSKFQELYTAFFVLKTGCAPTKEEVPSPEAVRINMERLNEIDKFFIGQMFADIAKEPSSCGNRRFFSSLGDDSKQGARKKIDL
jgi:hypothetical protein